MNIVERYADGERHFAEADLRGANLSEANLSGADLSEADLRGARLIWANLSEANLSEANLREANLRGANLSEANLRGARLSEANLIEANLRGANLRGANLRGANLSEANLRGAKLPHFQIPQGDLVAHKKVAGKLIELMVPARAERTASLVGRKCRAQFAFVRKVEGGEPVTTRGLTYIEGQEVWPDRYDPDIRVECTNGIHFFLTREEAEEWW